MRRSAAHYVSSSSLPANQPGFTAVELMTALAIIAVLATLGAPSFTSLIESWRVRTVAEKLESSLYYARSEAIKRGGGVLMQKIPNHTGSCTSATGARDWDCGWIVCVDEDRSGSCSADEPVLQHMQVLGQVRVNRTGGGTTIKWNRWGSVDGTFVGFRLYPTLRDVTHPGARGLCMSSGGRIRTISQRPISCS